MAKKQLTQADRVSFSLGRALPKEQYGGKADIHVSYSTDVEAGETPKKAMRRAAKFVQGQLERHFKMLDDL